MAENKPGADDDIQVLESETRHVDREDNDDETAASSKEKVAEEAKKKEASAFTRKLKSLNPLKSLGKGKKEDVPSVPDVVVQSEEQPLEDEQQAAAETSKDKDKDGAKLGKKLRLKIGRTKDGPRDKSSPREAGGEAGEEASPNIQSKVGDESLTPKAGELSTPKGGGPPTPQTGEPLTPSAGEDRTDGGSKSSGRRMSAKEKLKQKLEKKKSTSIDRDPRIFRQQSSRVEDRLKEEELEAQQALERHLNKQNKKNRGGSNRGVQPVEAYNFFTQGWEGGELEEVVVEPTDREQEDEYHTADEGEGGDTAQGDRRKLLAKQFIGKTYDWKLTDFEGPEVVTYQYRVEKEKDIYFVPSVHEPTLQEKLGDPAVQPVEEGIYSGSLPKFSARTLNKMQNRIIAERVKRGGDPADWFMQNGTFNQLGQHLTLTPSRPAEQEYGVELTRFVSAQPTSQDQQLINPDLGEDEHCRLELDLASLIFNHHHLFSLEHHLTRKLMDVYHDYSTKVRNSTVATLTDRLRTLYEECKKVEDLSLVATEDERLFQTRRLTSYRKEIKALRTERDQQSFDEREMMRSILEIWRDLREVRKKQNFNVTSHKLIIHKETTNADEDLKSWRYELEKEFLEKRNEFDLNREEDEKSYSSKLDEWKTLHARRKEVRQRHKKQQKDMEKGKGTVDATQFAEDEELLAEPEPEKPAPLPEFDGAAVRKEIEENARKMRRNPGEPKLTMELNMSGKVTKESDIYDNREVNRRTAVNKTKVILKIFFNGKEVCHTQAKPIGQDFVIPLGQIFPIEIVQWPESLKVQIIEGRTLKSHVIAEINLPICDSKTSLDKTELIPFEFTSDEIVTHGHAGLGSGSEFTVGPDNSRIDKDFTRGRLYARVGWAKTSDGNGLLAPPQQSVWSPQARNSISASGSSYQGQHQLPHIKEVFDAHGNVDPEKLEEWLLSHRIDPNDPRNAELISSVAQSHTRIPGGSHSRHSTVDASGIRKASEIVDQGVFRLDQMDDQFSFCSEEELNNNVRYQIIQLRSAKAPDFRNYKMIPAYEKEIPRGILESYAKKMETRHKEVDGSSDPIRGKSFLFMEQLRNQVSHKFSIAKHRKRRGDIIVEDAVPDLNTLFMMLGGMAPEQRPLRPVRHERKKVTLQDLTGHEVKVIINAVRAYDVPVRHDPDPILNPQGGGVSGPQAQAQQQTAPRESLVNSYISATLQNSKARTVAAPGPNPAWNQELVLSFKPQNNDFSPDTMRTVKDCLHLHLYDEILVDLLEDERERQVQIHHRIEHKWLGSLAIPFTSIYQNTRIEGTFRLHSPAVLLGYDRLGQNLASGWPTQQQQGQPAGGTSAGDGGAGAPTFEKDATYLNIYLTLEPALNVPEPVREKLECAEEDEILAICGTWQKALTAYGYAHRHFSPLVIDTRGRSVLVTRYLRQTPLPAELRSGGGGTLADEDAGGGGGAGGGTGASSIGAGASAELMAAWFVSLLPYLPSNAMFPGLGDIWPTSDEVLQMMAGSEAEHAILLVNYLLGLGVRTAYLVVGRGVPEGKTAYVLSVDSNSGQYRLWNPVTSECFSTNETFCPLQSVWALVSPNNVWANIQLAEQPQRIRWDVTNSRDWLPLFPRAPQSSLHSIQPDHLIHLPPDPRGAKLLKEKVEKVIRDNIMTWRKKINLRTSLNFQGKALLGKLLPKLENGRLNISRSGAIVREHRTELESINASYKVCGFPLHFAYRDMDSLVEAVKATGVWETRDPKAEFSVAVHVEAYPAAAMSVWIYVASLIRRK